MAQITRGMCESIIAGFHSKAGYPLTNWEVAQLAYAWLERDDARRPPAPEGAAVPAIPVGKLIRGEGGAFRFGWPENISAIYALPPGEHDLYVAEGSATPQGQDQGLSGPGKVEAPTASTVEVPSGVQASASLAVVGYRRKVPILSGYSYEVCWHWSTKTGEGWEPIYGVLGEGEEAADYETWKNARSGATQGETE